MNFTQFLFYDYKNDFFDDLKRKIIHLTTMGRNPMFFSLIRFSDSVSLFRFNIAISSSYSLSYFFFVHFFLLLLFKRIVSWVFISIILANRFLVTYFPCLNSNERRLLVMCIRLIFF